MRHLALALASLLALYGCSTENTCREGSAMTNPTVLRPRAVAAGAQLPITWEPGTGRGAELPSAYFAAAKVRQTGRDIGPDGPEIEPDVTVISDREIAVMLRAPVDNLRNRTVRFTLEMPDRMKFIDCTHGEGTDHYDVDVRVVFKADGSIAESSVTERPPYGVE